MADYLGMNAPERNEAREKFLNQFSSDHQPTEYKGGRISPVKRYAGIIADAERVITDHLPDILFNQIMLATGQATQQVVNVKTGEIVTLRMAPDAKAGQYLMDRIAGKPVNFTQMEVSGEVKHNGLVIHLSPTGPPPTALPQGDISPEPLALPEPRLEVIDVKRRGRHKKPKVIVEGESDATAE